MTELSCVLVETREDVHDIFERHLKFLPKATRTIAVTNGISSHDDYNRLLTDVEFWYKIPTEKILIIQHDSELLRTGIEEFYQWDYIGAPWNFQHWGGNGGLSLRSRSAMIETIERHKWKGENEDIFFSNNLVGNLAPREECSRFSVETVFQLGTLGAHAIDSHFTSEQCKQIRNQYL